MRLDTSFTCVIIFSWNLTLLLKKEIEHVHFNTRILLKEANVTAFLQLHFKKNSDY